MLLTRLAACLTSVGSCTFTACSVTEACIMHCAPLMAWHASKPYHALLSLTHSQSLMQQLGVRPPDCDSRRSINAALTWMFSAC